MPDWTLLHPTFVDCFAALDSSFTEIDSSRRETADTLSAMAEQAALQAAQLARPV